ncbi:hypothetical protein AKJ16_DCAP02473 [Drosera capensis]
MSIAGIILRRLSVHGEGYWNSMSKRWTGGHEYGNESLRWENMEGLQNMNGVVMRKKRVMVVVDGSAYSKSAMMWALTHVANKGDLVTLIHVVGAYENGDSQRSSDGSDLASSLGSLCKSCKPEVEIEALVTRGPKLATILSQVKKLEVSVLVLGQKRPSPIINCLCGMSSSEELAEECINGADCLTIGVRKQSRGMGGYLISTRWQKNFWLLA